MSEEKICSPFSISSSFSSFLQGSSLVASHFMSHQNMFGGSTDFLINTSTFKGRKMCTSFPLTYTNSERREN